MLQRCKNKVQKFFADKKILHIDEIICPFGRKFGIATRFEEETRITTLSIFTQSFEMGLATT
jgi:hypothetical protein